MPNVKSAIKRVEIAKKRNAINTARKSAMKTAIKRFEQSLASGEQEQIHASFKRALQAVDKNASRGIIHKNTAARKKSQLQKKLNSSIS